MIKPVRQQDSVKLKGNSVRPTGNHYQDLSILEEDGL